MQQYVGMRLGAYQVVEQIGQGGMATVCKAYQPSVDRYVAIKILPSHFTKDESFVERFTQEARTLARLEHAHILPVYDYGEQEGITYLVMRFVEAGTLKDLIHREGPIDVKEAARIVGQVGAALDCGHSQGVIHRDIKPSNVLIDEHRNTFLTDFGIAKLVAETAHFTASGAIIGTPAYMSPEQGMGQPVDARCDIYSLGVVLYELVTGRVPFQAETPLAVLLKHLNAPLPPPRQIKPDLPEAVERVILKAMAKSPDDRYQNVRELVTALDQAVVDAAEERSRPQPPEDQLEKTVLTPRVSPPPPVVASEVLAEQQRQAELDDLHDQAVGAMDARQWARARALLAQIQQREPGYRDVESLLDRAEAELEQAEADGQRREQIASLYEEAQSLARDRQWRPALAKMDEIHALDAEFADQEGIAARAREQAAAEEAEAQRQIKVAALYAVAVRLLKAGQYEEALQRWGEVQAIDPGYRDRKKVQATARKKLDRLAKPATKRRPPRWAWIAAGTVAVAAIAVAAALLLRTLSTAPPTPGRIPAELQAGTVWKWSDGSAMVYVPAGTFWMGTDENDPDANPDEGPQHLVSLDAFWIDRTEVTNAQYERCVKDEGCSPPSETTAHIYGDYYGESAYDDYPVIHVRWEQANIYCAWAGKRLPTEAEWERAARGTDKRIYPWGNEFDGTLANFCDDRCTFPQKDRAWDDGYASTAPVGSYEGGASPYGAWDMAGNMHEWTSSLDWAYPYSATDGREDPEAPGPRVVRGGSLGCDPWNVRTALRHRLPPASIQIDLGFRCVQSAAEPLAQSPASAQPLPAPTGPSRTATQTAEAASGESHRDLGISLLERGEYELAFAQFDQASALDPEKADLYYLRSQACSHWNRDSGGCALEEAVANVTRAIELDATIAEYWFARGIYYLDLANPQEALGNMERAIELDPGHAVAWAQRGSALKDLGEPDRAVESFERAIELEPQECIAYRGLAEVYRDQGQYQTALAACDRALERCPHLDSTYIVRGQIYLDQFGDATQALSDFDQAIQIAPDTAPYYHERGRAHAHLGQVAEAREDYETYLRLTEADPNAEYREEIMGWLEQNPPGAQPSPNRRDIPADPWGSVTIPPGDTIRLAFVGPLSGEPSSWGDAMRMAFAMAIEEAGSLQGFQLEAIFRDGGCEESIGEQTARELARNESVVGVIGHACSSSCRAGMPSYAEAHLVTISPSCTGPDLTELSEVFNRVVIRNDVVDWEMDLLRVVGTDVYQAFAESYQAHYGQPIPEVPTENGGNLAVYAAHTYDAANILIQSIERVAVVDASGNLVIGREALARTVRSTSDYRGVTGIISFDETGDRVPPEEGPRPQPTSTPAPTPLPGTEVIPISQMAPSIPWLPLDQNAIPSTLYYVFNESRPPFDDVRVRQAFSLAVDRERVASTAGSFGVVEPRPAITFTPREVLGRDLYREVGLGDDPDRAQRLLAEAGYPNGEGFPEITLTFNCSERYQLDRSQSQAIAEAIAAMWAQNLAVSVGTECIEGWQAYLAQLDSGASAIFQLGWVADVIDPDNFLSFFSTGRGGSWAHFSNSRFDRLVEDAVAAADRPTARQALYIQAERILCEEEAVIVPLYHWYTE
jgi:formylglycine-generating enzyme required for sulfatase activity/ABC-type branched-subunit amino acid transport system substrate-binding protein/Flp pilus assembly protein TadD/predicted Ser/Thr protein kinase